MIYQVRNVIRSFPWSTYRNSYAAMIDVLRQDPHVDIERFDELGLKTLAELHQELDEGDKILMFANGRATTVTASVKVILRWRNLQAREVSRRYFSGRARHVPGGILIEQEKPEASRESRKRDKQGNLENVTKTILRALKEECGHVLPVEAIPHVRKADKPSYGESSVFPGIFSIRHTASVIIHLTGEQWWPKGHRYRDGSVEGTIRWGLAT